MIQRLLDRFVSDKKMHLPIRFIATMALVYASWRTFKYFGELYPGWLWGGWAWFKDLMGYSIMKVASWVLAYTGYHHIHNNRLIIVDGYPGIYAGDLCLGIAPMVIFTGFILAFGDNVRNKIWFIPLGLVVIFLTNVMRMYALIMVQIYYKKYFALAHDYVYLGLTYGFIFFMVMWWMNSLAFNQSKATEAVSGMY